MEGLRGLPNYADVGVVFEATSAGAHIRNNEILQRGGKKVIDLTPAAIGPFTVPVINGDAISTSRTSTWSPAERALPGWIHVERIAWAQRVKE
jgi:acetaldehyde dehydrogenase (acetylating)